MGNVELQCYAGGEFCQRTWQRCNLWLLLAFCAEVVSFKGNKNAWGGPFAQADVFRKLPRGLVVTSKIGGMLSD